MAIALTVRLSANTERLGHDRRQPAGEPGPEKHWQCERQHRKAGGRTSKPVDVLQVFGTSIRRVITGAASCVTLWRTTRLSLSQPLEPTSRYFEFCTIDPDFAHQDGWVMGHSLHTCMCATRQKVTKTRAVFALVLHRTIDAHQRSIEKPSTESIRVREKLIRVYPPEIVRSP